MNMAGWRRVFQQQIQGAKPNDAWSIKMDRQLGSGRLESGWARALQEHAHASFTCSQCGHRWSSHQVVIQFLMGWDQGQVRMKVFRQQCDKCLSERYEEPQFTERDVSNVVRHLILDVREKCYGERVDRSELSEVVWQHTGPHRPEHCEACKLGIHKWPHRSSRGAQHHGKAPSGGHHRNTEETKPRAQPSEDSPRPVASCIGCFCLILIFVLISLAYLPWQNGA